jgi:hypothetical protein
LSFDDWRQPAAALRARLRPVYPEQRALAAKVELRLGSRTPALVAAAELSDHLGALIGHPVASPTIEQDEYLADLRAWSKSGERTPATRATAGAWIKVLASRRALEALKTLKPTVNDIVVEWRYNDRRRSPAELPPERRRIVASVGVDGTVYFRGGRGRRAPAHRIDVLYRADDHSSDAEDARTLAAREATARSRGVAGSETLSFVKVTQLRRWHVPDRSLTTHDVDRLRGVVDTAEDEKPIQLFLQDHPHLLAALLSGAQGRWVRPQVKFGARYVADFLIADADSGGIGWLMIELESPRVRALKRDGEWAKEARHAIHQIQQWRHYISEHPDACRKSPEEDDGLGLVDIEAGVPALILISRRDAIAGDPAWMRRTLRLNSGVTMHTYDWLIEQVERVAGGGSQLR